MDVVEPSVAVGQEGELAGLRLVVVDVNGLRPEAGLVLYFDEAHCGGGRARLGLGCSEVVMVSEKAWSTAVSRWNAGNADLEDDVVQESMQLYSLSTEGVCAIGCGCSGWMFDVSEDLTHGDERVELYEAV